MSALAPIVLPAPGATQWITVAGTQLPLPPDARVDLAYIFEQPIDFNPSVAQITVTTPGHYYEVPLSLSLTLTVSAGATDTIANLQFQDASGDVLLSVSAPASQPPDTEFIYNYVTGYPVALKDASSVCDSPLPGLVMQPGYLVQWTGEQATPPVTLDSPFWRSIRIPSGPLQDQITPLTETPKLT